MGIFNRIRGGAGAGRGDNPNFAVDSYDGTSGPPRPNPANRDLRMNAPRNPSANSITFGNQSAAAYETSSSLANQYARMSQNQYASDTARASYAAMAQQHQGQADMHMGNIQRNARNLDIWRDRRS